MKLLPCFTFLQAGLPQTDPCSRMGLNVLYTVGLRQYLNEFWAAWKKGNVENTVLESKGSSFSYKSYHGSSSQYHQGGLLYFFFRFLCFLDDWNQIPTLYFLEVIHIFFYMIHTGRPSLYTLQSFHRLKTLRWSTHKLSLPTNHLSSSTTASQIGSMVPNGIPKHPVQAFMAICTQISWQSY